MKPTPRPKRLRLTQDEIRHLKSIAAGRAEPSGTDWRETQWHANHEQAMAQQQQRMRAGRG